MTVIVDKRYAETKEQRAQSDLRDVRNQFATAHGKQRGERLLAMLTGPAERAPDDARPGGRQRGR
ncbi:hypothetical protein [Methylobacterium radiodurans]|uniref:Uncharacterized protein n=1 Tax=Methylobacterium radiodurans TaxID=2202828 RepID=A0A2U8VWT8_9HYPH|nr:hypothetical protein [Methylobacterium radiodurans]AWN37682.1 hypothetical protein DK427_19735 [Methylobacterium radiodurans]